MINMITAQIFWTLNTYRAKMCLPGFENAAVYSSSSSGSVMSCETRCDAFQFRAISADVFSTRCVKFATGGFIVSQYEHLDYVGGSSSVIALHCITKGHCVVLEILAK